MSEINRPTALVGVGIFLAPPGREIRPVMTDEGQELLEIITGGRVFFESEEGVREYERGTIFWHIEGEYTVFRTPPEDPYRCISIRFPGAGKKADRAARLLLVGGTGAGPVRRGCVPAVSR